MVPILHQAIQRFVGVCLRYAQNPCMARRERQAPHLSNGYYLNVRGVKGKKQKHKTEPDNGAQSARFIKAAKALGADKSGDAFERAFKAIAKEMRRVGPIRASGKRG